MSNANPNVQLVNQEWIAKESLRQLYINCVAAQLVHRGFDKEFRGKKGDTARILTPVEFVAKDFDETNGIDVQEIAEGYVALPVDNHLDVSFEYGSKEKALLMPDFRTRYIEPAMKAIAEEIDRRVLKQMGLYIPTTFGIPNTTPSSRRSILQARKNLQDQLVPMTGRKFIMDPAAEAEYLEIFSEADKDGSTAALREASLGRRFGLDTYMDQNVYTHTPGTLEAGAAATVQVNANAAAGATSMVLKSSAGTLSGTLVEGDKFTIAGVAGNYVVTALATAATNLITVNFTPALPSQAAQNAVVTIKGYVVNGTNLPYVCNPIFHSGCTALAFAALEKPDGAAWSQVVSYKGFGLRMVKAYDANLKKEVLSLDCLFGIKVIDGRLGTLLTGNDQ